MINNQDIIYWVWLAQAFGAGNCNINYILSNFNTPKDLYNFIQLNGFQNIKLFTELEIRNLKNTSLDLAKNIVEKCIKNNYEILTYNDKKYPFRLKNIFNSPILLYVNGDIGNIDDKLAITIIGARKCSNYAIEVTNLFASQLSRAGAVIISGMATGVDGIALKNAVDNNGELIAVVGCGLDISYPISNTNLKKSIEYYQNGCIISEYPPGTEPFRYNFPVRNRIMSALSVGVLVVESGIKSGCLITAKLAIEQGKDVYGIPNNIFCEENIGTMNLLKEGAYIVTSPKDILDLYRWTYDIKNIKVDNFIPSYKTKYVDKIIDKPDYINDSNSSISYNNEFDLESKDIYNMLKKNGLQSADDLSEKLDISVVNIMAKLTELEIDGYIKSYPGSKYGVN